MAITQISRITHRKGTQENLPQLAVGEFGWSVDTRQLYIGNGGGDAPSIENVEILTENSSIGETTNYTYADSGIGYTAVTGVSASAPTVRTLQAKIDDYVSVRDYGALGDGATDDTSAINRALTDLFVTQTFQATRRALLFPAGTYIVSSSSIKIPAHATIVGEGTKGSIIKRSETSITNVAQTADSKNQIGANIATSGGIVPSNISVINMVFEAGAEIDAFLVDQADNMYFENCTFLGNKTTQPSTIGSGKACVVVESLGAKYSTNIRFNNCIFQNHTYGVKIDDEVRSVVFDNCRFENLWKGAVIGQDDSTTSPTGVKIIGSLFDNIYDRGIHVYDGTFSSAFNHFQDVGNAGAGSGSPSTPVIEYVVGGCYSIGDTFNRPDADDATQPRIEVGTNTSFAMDGERVKHGQYARTRGTTITLADTASAITTTGLSFSDTDETYVEIEYSLVVGSTVRNGLMRITHDSGNQVMSDEFDENNGHVGVHFSLSNTGGTTTLNYYTDTATTATFTYSIRTLT